MWKHALALFLLIPLTAWLFISNPYMEFHRVTVEVKDKVVRQDPDGKEIAVIVYKMADGHTFEQSTNLSGWMAIRPGQQRELNVRPFDTHQNTWDNIQHFFFPTLLLMGTAVYLVLFLIDVNFKTMWRRNDKKAA